MFAISEGFRGRYRLEHCQRQVVLLLGRKESGKTTIASGLAGVSAPLFDTPANNDSVTISKGYNQDCSVLYAKIALEEKSLQATVTAVKNFLDEVGIYWIVFVAGITYSDEFHARPDDALLFAKFRELYKEDLPYAVIFNKCPAFPDGNRQIIAQKCGGSYPSNTCFVPRTENQNVLNSDLSSAFVNARNMLGRIGVVNVTVQFQFQKLISEIKRLQDEVNFSKAEAGAAKAEAMAAKAEARAARVEASAAKAEASVAKAEAGAAIFSICPMDGDLALKNVDDTFCLVPLQLEDMCQKFVWVDGMIRCVGTGRVFDVWHWNFVNGTKVVPFTDAHAGKNQLWMFRYGQLRLQGEPHFEVVWREETGLVIETAANEDRRWRLLYAGV
ncbi:hypothetical protein HDU79_009186 [Rhizoclosmatium sp. JEL0117]|nr:hypothetical protein HDU79_009186 [Rhizoclosmatium sp. JEL0117]